MTLRIPENEAALLRLSANLLYPPGDPRAIPWPDREQLGLIRSRLRGMADADDLADDLDRQETTR